MLITRHLPITSTLVSSQRPPTPPLRHRSAQETSTAHGTHGTHSYLSCGCGRRAPITSHYALHRYSSQKIKISKLNLKRSTDRLVQEMELWSCEAHDTRPHRFDTPPTPDTDYLPTHTGGGVLNVVKTLSQLSARLRHSDTSCHLGGARGSAARRSPTDSPTPQPIPTTNNAARCTLLTAHCLTVRFASRRRFTYLFIHFFWQSLVFFSTHAT